jgi:hypothetical protein
MVNLRITVFNGMNPINPKKGEGVAFGSPASLCFALPNKQIFLSYCGMVNPCQHRPQSKRITIET